MNHNIKFTPVFFIVLLFGFVSCFSVQRMAREFSEHKHERVVLVLPPSHLFYDYYPYNPDEKENHNTIYDISESNFIKNVEDSLYFEYFMEGLQERIERYNIDLYKLDSVDAFLSQEGKAYLFSIPQMELLEYKDIFAQEAVFYDELYVQEFERNNVVSNTWFEFNELSNSDGSPKILFSMQYMGDYFDGSFRMDWLSGEVTYQYTPYKIDISDVYNLAYFSGKQNGEYIVDYLFNLYLEDMLGEDELEHYYRYDRYRNSAQRADDNRFIIME